MRCYAYFVHSLDSSVMAFSHSFIHNQEYAFDRKDCCGTQAGFPCLGSINTLFQESVPLKTLAASLDWSLDPRSTTVPLPLCD